MTRRSRAEGAESRCLVRSEPKPKGLLGRTKERLSLADKNGRRPREMINPEGAKVARENRKADAGLVAGNVTGGGGKATTTKT